ncbi:unnamed protein product, partial [Trichogramma brassicae]
MNITKVELKAFADCSEQEPITQILCWLGVSAEIINKIVTGDSMRMSSFLINLWSRRQELKLSIRSTLGYFYIQFKTPAYLHEDSRKCQIGGDRNMKTDGLSNRCVTLTETSEVRARDISHLPRLCTSSLSMDNKAQLTVCLGRGGYGLTLTLVKTYF